MSRGGDRTVYSSGPGGQAGNRCPRCGKRQDRCKCAEKVAAKKSAEEAGKSPFVYVGRESKGRKGKTVTLVDGLPLAGAELKELAGELKRKCGTGGAVKDGVIEIQGDHRDVLVAELEARGYTVKRAGG